MAQAKVIDSKTEVEKRKLMSESDEYRIGAWPARTQADEA
jgi:hypothetical protein